MLPDYLKFSSDPSSTLSELLKELNPDHVAILVDENTREHCLPLVENSFPIIEISSGESNKTIRTCEHIWSEMTRMGMTRQSLLINLGGGVIGDMGGFCASTYKRGIRFINFPSTLLSMVDASIGGKLGVDFNGLKNHIGVFADPSAVVICDQFLRTLPQQQIKSGYAEVLKHALIQDEKYWEKVKEYEFQNANWAEIIRHSVEIKERVVSIDPKENGLRKILNFGHSLGHAIETEYLDTENHLLHGEAIAIGMILEAFISQEKGFLSNETAMETIDIIQSIYQMPKLPNTDELIKHLQQDKKNQGSTLNFSLIDKIGNCLWDISVSRDEIEKSLKIYEATIQKD